MGVNVNKTIPKWNEWSKKLLPLVEKYKYVLLVILIGIVLLCIPSKSSSTETSAAETTGSGAVTDFSLADFESQLEEALAQIDGAGKVRLVLTLKSGTEIQLAQDGQNSEKTSEKEGGSEKETSQTLETIILTDGNGRQEALVTKSIFPTFQGALVVCEGGDKASVKLEVVNAVSSLTGLGADKITVVKMKSN